MSIKNKDRWAVTLPMTNEEAERVESFFSDNPHLFRAQFIKMLLIREIKFCEDGLMSYQLNCAPYSITQQT